MARGLRCRSDQTRSILEVSEFDMAQVLKIDQRSNRRYDFGSISVLLVDQNRFIRSMVVNICRSFGVQRVYECDDAHAAFTLMKQAAIDLVITEWMLEPLDGRDFTRLVRSARDNPNPMVPIIMLTGHTQAQYVIEARDAGGTEFLCKPVSSRNLLNRMIHVIENPRPIVRSGGYVGPERRAPINPNHPSGGRRAGGARMADLGGAVGGTGVEWDFNAVPTGQTALRA